MSEGKFQQIESIPGVPDEVTPEIYEHDKADYEAAGRWDSYKEHYDIRLASYKAQTKPDAKEEVMLVEKPTSKIGGNTNG